jgi:hypothetical protein
MDAREARLALFELGANASERVKPAIISHETHSGPNRFSYFSPCIAYQGNGILSVLMLFDRAFPARACIGTAV